MRIMVFHTTMFYTKGNNMKGKLIVIEGTDCSGKETQSKKLIERFKEEGIEFAYFSFPCYDSPTGKIVGGPYLGKPYICEGWFPESAPNVDPKVSALYYAADRKYNIGQVLKWLEEGKNVILDRYVYSNMAHQGGKIEDIQERDRIYTWLENLEFGLLELPVPDIKVFLHVSYEASLALKKNRQEALDENEKDQNHLLHAERAYLEIAERYDFETIECSYGKQILTIDEIHEILYNYMKTQLKTKQK